ncbi:hypothetical protein E4U53_004448 [Claviceps sorghi]|nr:hypothetical protein E4U53_004448 [Claviceps sorghi]
MLFRPLVLSIVLAVPALAKSINDWRWCDGGTEGNTGCESKGQNTYCCITYKGHPDYPHHRFVSVMSRNMKNQDFCRNEGTIYCAPRY